jgi:hypothetical protein
LDPSKSPPKERSRPVKDNSVLGMDELDELGVTQGGYATMRKRGETLMGENNPLLHSSTGEAPPAQHSFLAGRWKYVFKSGESRFFVFVFNGRIAWYHIDFREQPLSAYYTLYVIMSVLGIVVSPFFFAYHLFDVINVSKQLQLVLRAMFLVITKIILMVNIILWMK